MDAGPPAGGHQTLVLVADVRDFSKLTLEESGNFSGKIKKYQKINGGFKFDDKCKKKTESEMA